MIFKVKIGDMLHALCSFTALQYINTTQKVSQVYPESDVVSSRQ